MTTGRARPRLPLLVLVALGVVYGDIGTSPLYAFKEAFHGTYGIALTPANVLGVLSLVVWSLVLVVVVKYATFVLRADNRGEGGILSLLALLLDGTERGKRRGVLVGLGLFGAALLYGDGVITPAISVLSAVEGLEIALPAVDRFVVPITVAILVGLFLVQHRGTARMGSLFGPITLLWFLAIGAIGVLGIVRRPEVLAAFDPRHAIAFFATNGLKGYFVLAAVVLVVTGAEALYADLGHFGIKPIRIGWFAIVFPALLLNYFGQGALLIADPTAVEHPFFRLVPEIVRLPMVGLATAATIIASQAMISAAFSLTRQAVQLGYFPRVRIVHTSEHAAGQIYVPEVNALLMVACLTLVLVFRESSALAAAYGMAVVGTFLITSTLFGFVARRRWGWSRWVVGGLVAFFMTIEFAFLGANLVKIAHGGWLPLAIGAVIFTVMTTWRKGRDLLQEHMRSRTLPVEILVDDLARPNTMRVSGTAVVMTREAEGIPPVLLHHYKHNKVLHERVVLLSILSEDVPVVTDEQRAVLTELGSGMYRIVARYGFMETPNVIDLLESCETPTLEFKAMETTFFLGRETLLATGRGGMAGWRKKLFAFLTRNATSATAFYGIPPNRVVELGTQVVL